MESPSGIRIVYFGTPEFAAHILRHLIDSGEHVVGVVTTPDKPQGRGRRMKGSAVRAKAEQFRIPVLTPTKHRDPDFLAALRELDADLFVVVAYKILPMEVIRMPRLGAFNVHASLLPKYRGAAPINWAIMRGERETGVTTFLLDEQVDTGNLLLSKGCEIGPEETAGELHDKLMMIGSELALLTIRGLAERRLHPVSQADEKATTAPKIFPHDCIIDLSRTALEVHDFIRGLSPHPGAVMTLENGVKLKILRTRLAAEQSPLSPGNFKHDQHGKRLFVGSSDSTIEILELQREGKRAMSTEEFLRGNMGLFDS